MVVLEVDGFFWVIYDLVWEENSVVEQFVVQVDDQVDVGVGWFGSGDFVDIFFYLYNVCFLIFYLVIVDDVVVNMVVEGVVIFDVNFVVLVVVVGIDQMFIDKVVEVMFVESVYYLFFFVLLRIVYVFKK